MKIGVYATTTTILAIPKKTESGDDGYLLKKSDGAQEWMSAADFKSFYRKIGEFEV